MCPREPEPEFILKPLSPIRKAIAKRVSDSFRDVPQFDVHVEVDASAMKTIRQQYKDQGADPVPGFNDMLIQNCAGLLQKHKNLNCHYTVDGIKEFSEINISFAAATPQGVLMPVVRRANQKPLTEIAKETRELSDLARNMKLRASLQMHGTFAISSLGGFGIDGFNAIIGPPQVAILAAGAIIQKPKVKAEKIEIVPVIELCLTVDHRAVDGAESAGFLKDLRIKLESYMG
jgi:pyruvate dehydrogenase E2 component (dihydrolipoamide acetyltransferase)